MSKIRLYCLPFAGGNSAFYQAWRRYSLSSVEFAPLELAGRGRRMGEPFSDSIPAAARDAFSLIENEINYHDYAIFGHSMGAVIAFELARLIKNSRQRQPVHLIFSGRKAPHLPIENPEKIHHLSEPDFQEKILNMGGTSPALFTNPQLREIFLPILRNDFRITENYSPDETAVQFDCPLSVITGKDEDFTGTELSEWQNYTGQGCDFRQFKGGHFFILEDERNVLEWLDGTLRLYL